jgi:hypothetical protein
LQLHIPSALLHVRGTFAQQVFALQSLFRKQGACAETSSTVPLQPECVPPECRSFSLGSKRVSLRLVAGLYRPREWVSR